MGRNTKKQDGIPVKKDQPQIKIQIQKRVTDPATAARLRKYSTELNISPSQALLSLGLQKLKEMYPTLDTKSPDL